MTAPASSALHTARAIVDELVRGGVSSFMVAPGSRSTALALAVAERGDVSVRVFLDERSMGFFALGAARAGAAPIAVITTSGTAAANLVPAAAEATLGGGSLVLLTADRPPELRDCAAPQTIEQVRLFAGHARWSADVPMLEPGEQAARVLRSVASRALETCRAGRGGVVHLNVPLREPFVDDSWPLGSSFEIGARTGRAFTECAGSPSLSPDESRELAALISRFSRGAIVCAGHELPAARIAALAARLGWPILADPMSGLRFGPHDRSHVVDCHEPLLRDERLRAVLRPDCILRFGMVPAPRSVQRWLEEAWPCEHVLVCDDDSAWPDPFRSVGTIVRSDPARACESLLPLLPARSGGEWLERWRTLSAGASCAMDEELGRDGTLFDGAILRALVLALAAGSNLVVGNSMPVRDLDTFVRGADKPLRVFANRGASGIDGVVSTALGIAAASGAPTALAIGDLSLLHDATALAFAARERLPLLVVAVHNDGGGIFSYLPLHAELERRGSLETFEKLFGTPHGTDLRQLAEGAGCQASTVGSHAALAAALCAGIAAAKDGPALVEVRTDRDEGRRVHLAAVAAAQRAASSTGAESPRHGALPMGAHQRRRTA